MKQMSEHPAPEADCLLRLDVSSESGCWIWQLGLDHFGFFNRKEMAF